MENLKMPTSIDRAVEAARQGTHAAVVARMPSGWAVLGDKQVLRGYCLLLPDPVVPDLNALELEARSQFLDDMGRLGDAVLAVTGAARINYAIFGNLDPALHAHVVPRYRDEPDVYRTGNPWVYDWTLAPSFDADRDGELLALIREALSQDI
jgi:diadenosine tetraphosphate (Ap4A) HIT family hydrolase